MAVHSCVRRVQLTAHSVRAPARACAAAPRSPRFFVNLTNGVEVLPVLQRLGVPFTFVRLQSSLCEAQAMETLCAELDTHLLVSLALGHDCFVVDYASRNKKRGVPRALWYGCEFAAFALETCWFGAATKTPCLRGVNVLTDFTAKLRAFDKVTLRRLKYYRRFLAPGVDRVRLYGLCGPTLNDPNKGFYDDLMLARCAPAAPPMDGSRADSAAAGLGMGMRETLAQEGLHLWTGNLAHVDYALAMAAQEAPEYEDE